MESGISRICGTNGVFIVAVGEWGCKITFCRYFRDRCSRMGKIDVFNILLEIKALIGAQNAHGATSPVLPEIRRHVSF